MRMARSTSPRRRYERTQSEMSLDGVGVGLHQLQEHVERPVGLLGHEVVEAGQIVGMQLLEGGGPALAPTEMPGQYSEDQCRDHQNPSQQR